MKNKYNLNQITRFLDKLFKVNYTTEKDILAIQLDDLGDIPDISSTDITILIDLKRAIRSKKIIAFLSGNENKKREDEINGK